MVDLCKIKEISVAIDKEKLKVAFRKSLQDNSKELGLTDCENCGVSNNADLFEIAELLADVAIEKFKECEVIK